jgi:hypothetical protein
MKSEQRNAEITEAHRSVEAAEALVRQALRQYGDAHARLATAFAIPVENEERSDHKGAP